MPEKKYAYEQDRCLIKRIWVDKASAIELIVMASIFLIKP